MAFMEPIFEWSGEKSLQKRLSLSNFKREKIVKMTKEHFDELKAAIDSIPDIDSIIFDYKERGLSKTRFAFDCFYYVLGNGQHDNLLSRLYSYLNDSNIQTALFKILGDRYDAAYNKLGRKIMAFMEPVITEKQDWIVVDGPAGIEYIPFEYVGHEGYDEVAAKVEASGSASLEGTALEIYVENNVIYDIDIITGYGAYFSAPGYLDRTDVVVFDTIKEAEEYIEDEEVDMSRKAIENLWVEKKITNEDKIFKDFMDLCKKVLDASFYWTGEDEERNPMLKTIRTLASYYKDLYDKY